MNDVEVSGVGTTGTETMFIFVDSSLLQQRAEVFRLTRVQLVRVPDDCSSGPRDLLGLYQGQSLEARIGEA
jgi:hypothetical protein